VVLGPGALGIFLTVYLLNPFEQISYHWPRKTALAAGSALALLIAGFVLYFGNRQFGAYDFSILIDTGWRLAQGQQPYRDFVCTLPPGFYLGLKYAFALFGVNWNAQLWASALFGVVTFAWLCALFSVMLHARMAALLLAFTIESSGMLTLDFWWYNNITALVAAVFLLSCLAYLAQPAAVWIQGSYIASLALLSVMKPNVAGPLITGAAILTLIGTRRRTRFVLLTLLAAGSAFAWLKLNGISVSGMFASYLAAARVRGGFSTFGFREMRLRDLARVIICFAALLTPVIVFCPRWRDALRRRNLPAVARPLLFGLAACVSGFAMFSNGELKDVEWCALIACGAVLVFGRDVTARRLRRFYAAFLCALVFSDLYMGAVRLRVEGIGRHTFFEWHDSAARVDNPFFRDLRASTRFRTVVDQIADALKRNPGPVFFGPRMEFAYAAFGLPSPTNLPVWWHPGTSFAAGEERALLQAWQAHRFATLVFLKNDFTYYSPQFMNLLSNGYSRDEQYPELTVFHSRTYPK
jgi:hypothetical protein